MNFRLILFLAAIAIAGTASAQQTKGSPEKFFTVDRSTLPPGLRNAPLEKLSSGALMLFNRNGNLVRPPRHLSEKTAAHYLAINEATAVALDPRIASNLRLGDDPAGLPSNMRAQAEPHIARSVVNPDLIVATFQEGRFTNGGSVDCGYSATSDGGLSWSRALIQNLTTASGGTYARATDPVAGWDLSGNVYLNTLAGVDANFTTADILMSKSTNGGATFAAPTIVFHQTSGSVSPDKNWMAINTFSGTPTAGRIVVTFTRFGSTGSPILRTYSDNGGASWSAVTTIHTGNPSTQGSQPVFLPNGNLVIVYWNYGTSPERLQNVISTDGGVTFGAVKLISTATEYNEASIRSGSVVPSAVADRVNGYIYVVYQAILSGNPRVAFSRSLDGGNTWSAPVAISDNPAGSGLFNPAINTSPDGQTLSVIFYDHRNNPGSNVLVDLYLAQSFDGGTTWQPNIRLTSVSTDASLAPLTSSGYMLGDYLGVAEATNVNVPAVPVWVDTRTTNPDPFISRIGMAPQLNYASWQASRMSLGQINNPLLGGKTGNADFDGKQNLMEYALGTEPLVSDAVGASLNPPGATLGITFPRLKAATDVTLHAYRSSDLGSTSWTTSGVTETMLTDDGTIQTWQASVPATSAPTFFRLQAQ